MGQLCALLSEVPGIPPPQFCRPGVCCVLHARCPLMGVRGASCYARDVRPAGVLDDDSVSMSVSQDPSVDLAFVFIGNQRLQKKKPREAWL